MSAVRLTIAVAQPLSLSHDVAGNAERHAAAIRAAEARVVVFPELSLTGYELETAPISLADERLAPIMSACTETGSVALAGAPANASGHPAAIAMLRFGPGEPPSVAYRKMWLGGDEPDWFSAGDEPAVMSVDGWRLGLAICKDTGVPQHADATAALGIDVYAAGVLETDDDRDVQPARARRVTSAHGVWVAVASFAGSTGGGFDRAAGQSAIWRPDGSVAAQAGTEPGEIARATIARLEPVNP